jgi:hypothetical protein
VWIVRGPFSLMRTHCRALGWSLTAQVGARRRDAHDDEAREWALDRAKGEGGSVMLRGPRSLMLRTHYLTRVLRLTAPVIDI